MMFVVGGGNCVICGRGLPHGYVIPQDHQGRSLFWCRACEEDQVKKREAERLKVTPLPEPRIDCSNLEFDVSEEE